MTRRRSRYALFAALSFLSLSCHRCHETHFAPVATASDLLPRQVESVVVVPHLAGLGAALIQLSQLRLAALGAALAGEGDMATVLGDLRAQLGFDLTVPASIDAVGLAPEGALVIAGLPNGQSLAIFQVSDDARFDAAITKLAKDRVRATIRVDENGLVRFSAPSDATAQVAYGRSGRLAVVSMGRTALTLVRAALTQVHEQSLSVDPEFATLQSASADATGYAYVPTTSSLATQAGAGQGISVRLQVAAHELIITADSPLTPTLSAGLTMAPGAGQDLVAALDPDAVMVARLGVDPGPLWKLIEPQVPIEFRRQLLQAGLVANDVLGNLKPGAAFTLALPGQLDLSPMPSFDPRQTNPFRYLYLAGLGRAKDPAAALATLETTRKFGKQLGAELETSKSGNDPVYTFKYELGEGASIALDADEVVVSGGDQRLAPLLGRLHTTDGGPTLPPDAAARFAHSGSALYLDLDRIADRVRAFPSSAYGLGGFAIRAALMRWVDAVNDLHHLSLTADAQGAHLHLELRAGLP